ncbi:helix-turn-helix transcriptional regulator [Streptomyces sp. TR1341]|uniref:helix-turn-helix domain-containing protein n=1 Tax=Streptomyces TaxID=1883 RepID=UPI00138ABEEE|nr:helix-turn-helix transcriptional regulator [Streptomyces sp. TR1341]
MSFEEADAARRGPRKLTDPKAMRAVAHPTRLALLEALNRREPLTATEAARMVGESPTNCAFHLRTLAKYGFVEEAAGGTGRSRPWRRVHIGFTVDGSDPGNSVAEAALSTALWDSWLDRIRRVAAVRHAFPEHWDRITSASESVFYLTPAEAEAFQEELTAVFFRYRERLEDPSLRPEGAVPMELIQFTFPADALYSEED